MKIAIACYPTYGGSGVVATELGIACAKAGHEVHFVTYAPPTRLNEMLRNVKFHQVEMMHYPLFEEYPPFEVVLVSRLVQVVEQEDIDLIHVHYAIPHAFAAHAAREILRTKNRNVPFITTLHGTDITLVGKEAIFEPVVTFSINASDAVTAVSEHLRDDTYRHFNVKKNIHVIPNFVDLGRFAKRKSQAIKKAICPSDEKLLIHVSNFRKVKRTPDVLGIFKRVYQKIPSKLLMVGEGPEKQKVQEKCREMCQKMDVRFLGEFPQVEDILAISDLMLLPSESESFGMVALEAHACGVPVVGTRVGGLPGVVEHGVSGYLCEVGDLDGMARHSIQALEGKTHAELSRGALVQAKKFDINTVLPAYLDLYETVLMAGSSGRAVQGGGKRG